MIQSNNMIPMKALDRNLMMNPINLKSSGIIKTSRNERESHVSLKLNLMRKEVQQTSEVFSQIGPGLSLSSDLDLIHLVCVRFQSSQVLTLCLS